VPRIAFFLLAGVCCLAAAVSPALARDKTEAASAAANLPEPMTKESIRELVSRLDDAEVRALLIKQLDRTAAPAPAKQSDGMGDMAHAMGSEFARARARAGEIFHAAADFPAALGQVATRIAEPQEPSRLWAVAGWFLVMLAVGAAAEHAFGFATAAVSRRFDARAADGYADAVVRFALRAGIGLAHIAVFTVAAVGLFFALWQGHEGARLVMLVSLAAVVGVRLGELLVRLLLEPGAPRLRALPFGDRGARTLYWGLLRLTVLFALGRVFQLLIVRYGAADEVIVLVNIGVMSLGLLLILDTIWRLRVEVGALIQGTGETGHLRHLLAHVWPALAVIYLLAIYLSRLQGLLLGQIEVSYAPIASIVLALALPLADMMLCRIVAAAMRTKNAHGSSVLAESFEPVLRRAIHIVVLVAGLLILADLWQVNLFAMAERGLGGRIVSALFGIAITTLLAWILWEVARTAIDRRMTAETVPGGGDKPASRLRTLLPLLRVTLQVTIMVMAILSVLAALGINIVPLLAGASVVGVAIGFGSQTLVRDIVSGAFFLMDDAFRLGEYIEVGDAKGTVEKIGVRAVILRHHRGALNVLPYGEIKRLRNTSRDWMIMKLEFRLAYDTDLKKVKQIIKKVGAEIAADAELSRDLIEPLKSQGVAATDETGLVVRVKYMANPAGGGAYTIRREAFARIIKAFTEADIKFAERRVTVNVPAAAPADAAAAAATSTEAGRAW